MKIQITFEESDIQLLKRIIPDSPCSSCPESFGCCGCPKAHAYEEDVAPYKEANIYEYAVTLREMKNLNIKIVETKKKLNKLLSELPDEIQPLGKPFVVS